MRASSMNYKGIQYVQISSLPVEQKKMILTSINQKLIITILKKAELLHDCLQYQHYLAWYENVFSAMKQENTIESRAAVPSLTFAFK